VTLHASVTLFTGFTFVTTGTLWTLEEEEEEEEGALSGVQASHCPHAHGDAEAWRKMEENINLQQDHEHQQDQGGQRDLGDPGTGEKGTGQHILHLLLPPARGGVTQHRVGGLQQPGGPWDQVPAP